MIRNSDDFNKPTKHGNENTKNIINLNCFHTVKHHLVSGNGNINHCSLTNILINYITKVVQTNI